MSLSVPGSRLSETNKYPGEQEIKMTASSFFFRLSQCYIGRSGRQPLGKRRFYKFFPFICGR